MKAVELEEVALQWLWYLLRNLWY